VRLAATVAAATVATVAAAAGDAADPSARVTVVRRCLVEYEQDTPVGPAVAGVLRECFVEPGQRVKAGQPLGRLDDEDVRAEVKLREAEAASDVDVRLGEARSAQAQAKVQRTAALLNRHATSQEEFAQHKLEAAAAALEVERAKHRREVAAIQLEGARAALRTRTLYSPHDGVVAAVLRRPGESLVSRDVVFQVVDTARLRVVGQVDVTDAWRFRVGQPVRVVAEVAGADVPVEHESFDGRLTFIDTRIDPLTRTCKVFARVENRRDLLRAGLEARIEIDPEVPTAAAPPRAAEPPRAR
jgi:RND family efflux transporter MFP subunit